MTIIFLVLAGLIAVTHLSFIVFLVAGGFIGRRRPRVRVAHLWSIAITLAINLTGSPCPLTVWQKDLLEWADRVPYENGFISHYLVEPIHAGGVDGTVNLIFLLGFVVPIALVYLLPRSRRAS